VRRRLAPIAVDDRAVEIAPPDHALRRLEPPPVDHAGVTIAPAITDRALPLDAQPVDLEGVYLAPPVDVVPVGLAGTLFAERVRAVRIPGAEIHEMPLVTAPIRSPAARLRPPDVIGEHPERVARMFRRATPVERLPADYVRECVRRLYRQSGLSSPAELGLVGIFERIPGGAVHAVSQHPRGVVLRLDHRARAHPATLVVGKRRRDGVLVTAEVEPRPARTAC
jgi:hypothetical protein